MPQNDFSRPQPQYWVKFPDAWMQDFHPVLGCSQRANTAPPNTSEIRRRGRWKRGICIKLSEIVSRFCDKMCNNFVHPSEDPLMHKTKHPQFCANLAQFATNLSNAPLVNAPLLGISEQPHWIKIGFPYQFPEVVKETVSPKDSLEFALFF